MLKPLSVWVYYQRNILKILPITVIIVISVFAVVVGSSLLNFLNQETEELLKYYKNYYELEIESSKSTEEFKSRINYELDSYPETQLVISDIYRYSTGMTTPLGTSYRHVDFIQEYNFQTYMRDMGWVLNSGRMPQPNTKEIVLSESILKNKGLQIGDRIGSEVQDKEFLPGEFIIVGTLRDSMAAGGFGSFEYIKSLGENSSYALQNLLLLKPYDWGRQELQTRLDRLAELNPEVKITTEQTFEQQLISEYSVFNQIKLVAISVVTIVITLSVGLIQVIFISQRSQEFALLIALGYSRGFLLFKSFLEIFGVMVFSTSLGLMLTEFGLQLLNSNLLFSKGLNALSLFERGAIFYALPVPISVLIFSLITVFWMLKNINPILTLEKRT